MCVSSLLPPPPCVCAVSSDGLTPSQWAGVVYARILLAAACALTALSALPTTFMCTERAVKWQCCGAFSMTFLSSECSRRACDFACVCVGL